MVGYTSMAGHAPALPPLPPVEDGDGQGADGSLAAGFPLAAAVRRQRVAVAAGPPRPISDITVFLSNAASLLLAKILFSLYDSPALMKMRDEVRHRVLLTPEGACWSCPAMVLAFSKDLASANKDPKSALTSFRLSAARLVRSFWQECKVAELGVCPDHHDVDAYGDISEQEHALFI